MYLHSLLDWTGPNRIESVGFWLVLVRKFCGRYFDSASGYNAVDIGRSITHEIRIENESDSCVRSWSIRKGQ